jgi:hypothetical protein
VFAGRLAAVTAGAGMADVGMVVALGKGLLVAAGPVHPPRRTKTTTKYKSDRVRLSSAKSLFTELISRK